MQLWKLSWILTSPGRKAAPSVTSRSPLSRRTRVCVHGALRVRQPFTACHSHPARGQRTRDRSGFLHLCAHTF